MSQPAVLELVGMMPLPSYSSLPSSTCVVTASEPLTSPSQASGSSERRTGTIHPSSRRIQMVSGMKSSRLMRCQSPCRSDR